MEPGFNKNEFDVDLILCSDCIVSYPDWFELSEDVCAVNVFIFMVYSLNFCFLMCGRFHVKASVKKRIKIFVRQVAKSSCKVFASEPERVNGIGICSDLHVI